MNVSIKAAETFARKRHAGQTRKGAEQLPYVTHCEDVASIIQDQGAGPDVIIAGWLHDTLEDTETTEDEIAARFGPKVLALVLEVTDDPSLTKPEQRAAQIEDAPFKSPEAAIVKAADQISNMRSIIDTPPYWPRQKALAYIEKAEAVVHALPAPKAMKDMFAKTAADARDLARNFPEG
jgi:(p)ppGpp synthase/HD superfamily hydrolase